MGTKKISELIQTYELSDDSIFPVVKDGATRKVTYENLRETLREELGGDDNTTYEFSIVGNILTITPSDGDPVQLTLQNPSSSVNLTNYYTKNQADDKFATKESVSDLNDGYRPIKEITAFEDGYIGTSTQPVNMNNVTPNATYKHVVIDCSYGDVFTLTGVGGGTPRLYAFIDVNGNHLFVAKTTESVNKMIFVAPYSSAKFIVNVNINDEYSLYVGDKYSQLEKNIPTESIDVISVNNNGNLFNPNETHKYDGKYIAKCNVLENSSMFITHVMHVEPNTQYSKNESGYGVFYDEHMNIIGFQYETPLTTFTTPSNCKYYQTSATYGIADKFYVSKSNSFNFDVNLTDNAKSAVTKYVGSGNSNNKVLASSINVSPSYDGAVVTFIDDDGKAEVYTDLMPMLIQKGVKIGCAIITGKIGTDTFMTLSQLKEIYASGTVETLSHCDTQTTSLVSIENDLSSLDVQLGNSKKWLVANGFDGNAFVYPQNYFGLKKNSNIRDTMRKYYSFAFGGGETVSASGGFNENGYLDHSHICRVAMGSYYSGNPNIDGQSNKGSIDYLKSCVDRAKERGTWLVIYTHVADTTGGYTTQQQVAMYGELIDYINSNNIPIKCPTDAFNLKKNIVNIGDMSSGYLFVGNKRYATTFTGTVNCGALDTQTASTHVTNYLEGVVSMFSVSSAKSKTFPTTSGGILETYRDAGWLGYSWQKWTALGTCKQYMRFWDDVTNTWKDWVALN